MTAVIVAAWILSGLPVAQSVMAPTNLWTGRRMAAFVRLTEYPRMNLA